MTFPDDCVYPESPKVGMPLTKHEYFVGQALQGFFSGVPFPANEVNPLEAKATLESCADLCVMAADAVIERLNR